MNIRPADSNPHRNRWPNINEAEDEMMHFFYSEPVVAHSGDFDRVLKTFNDLPLALRYCLLCFFKFPPVATVKRTMMIYLWIGQGYIYMHLRGSGRIECKEERSQEEDAGNKIFDEVIAKGLIEPISRNCSLVPDSCRMSLSVRSSLYKEAEDKGFTSNVTLGLVYGRLYGSCLVNNGEAIVNCEPKIFEKMIYTESLYLGRWQGSATHHIEIADAKILHGLKNLKSLKFLSLRGISVITKLPIVILELKFLKIQDLRVSVCSSI